jgi:hypothetical protein
MINCVICDSQPKMFLSLGKTAPANSFLKSDEFKKERKIPLEVCFCETCHHVQLSELVPPDIMFKNYLYVSSTSETLRKHFSELAADVMTKISKDSHPLVVDIGSNDGTLLKEFKKMNARILGVEPATNIAKISEKEGIETVNDFFNEDVAKKIVKKRGKAKAVTGTNVFAHQPSYSSFLKGIVSLLDDEGIFVIEVPYLANLVQGLEFDTIYHEHVSYFAVSPLNVLYRMFGLEIFDVKKRNIHGGSIRVFARKGNGAYSSHDKWVRMEKELGLDSLSTFQEFAKKVIQTKVDLVSMLKKLKLEGKRIAGYGAAAKGNTLLSYCNIGTNLLDYIADKNPLKQGLYTPGTHIPVVSPGKIRDTKPDYLLILAWNFADEIIYQQKKFQELGGKFIIPLPEPVIL